jgi:ATP-binding protein involved in chromosome partitioning
MTKIIAVASGKGGVGKSTVATNLALALTQSGAKTGLLDADIYGPSIPTMLGITEKPTATEKEITPIEKFGLKTISMGMLTDPDQPVVWRGPMLASVLGQFLDQVAWGDLDYLIIDMPPGTGDVQLTLCQRATLAGAVIVTTPQDVALLDANRGLQMFKKVNVPILGIVENMSYFICDNCDKKHPIFKEGGGKRISEAEGIPLLAQLPIATSISAGGDSGTPIFISEPDSDITKGYQQLARALIEQLETKDSEKSDSPEMHLQWKS